MSGICPMCQDREDMEAARRERTSLAERLTETEVELASAYLSTEALREGLRVVADGKVTFPDYDWSDWNGGDAAIEAKNLIAEYAKLVLSRHPHSSQKVLEGRPTDTERLDWLDQHASFVADGEFVIGPYKVGELRKMADDGIEQSKHKKTTLRENLGQG